MPALHRDNRRLAYFYKQEADTGEFYWSWFLWVPITHKKNPGKKCTQWLEQSREKPHSPAYVSMRGEDENM